jgi:hypothetical protein
MNKRGKPSEGSAQPQKGVPEAEPDRHEENGES